MYNAIKDEGNLEDARETEGKYSFGYSLCDAEQQKEWERKESKSNLESLKRMLPNLTSVRRKKEVL
jgi:hypothetical protein